jgi:hypothetical protein
VRLGVLTWQGVSSTVTAVVARSHYSRIRSKDRVVLRARPCRIAGCENITHPNRNTSDVRPRRCANAMHYWCGTRARGSTSDPHSYRRVRLCDHKRARPARATTSVARRRSALGLRRIAFLSPKGACSAYSRDMSPTRPNPLRQRAPPHRQRSARLPAHPLPPTNPIVETSMDPV